MITDSRTSVVNSDGLRTTRDMLASRRGLPPAPLPWSSRGIDSLWALPSGPRTSDYTVSVIVPAWNSAESLSACIIGLTRALGGFDDTQAEIILVDDGSLVPASDSISGLRMDRDVHAVVVDHQGQSRASNTGAARARGDVLVFCDSDMVLNPWSITSLLEAIDRWPDGLCFGFREPTSTSAARLVTEALDTHPHAVPLLAAGDSRFHFDIPGVPSHLFAATHNLDDLTAGRRVFPPGRTTWSLPRMAFGCLLACRRELFLQVGGFDGRFVRWGYNDTELASRWIASGRPLVPVFTASGLHIEHAPRHPLQWRLAGSAAKMYERTLGEGWLRADLHCSPTQRVTKVSSTVAGGREPVPPLLTGLRLAKAAARIGDLSLFEQATGVRAVDAIRQPELAALALRALRLSADPSYLDLQPDETTDPATALEVGLFAIAAGDPARARDHLTIAATGGDLLDAGTARQLLQTPTIRRLRQADMHLRQGLTRAAASCALAALVADLAESSRQRITALLDDLPVTDRRVF